MMLDYLPGTDYILMVMALPILVLASPTVIRAVVVFLLRFRRKADKQSLQQQIIEYRKELAKISQVDEFAKYSKVQRKLRASSDQLNTIGRQDLELNFKYVLASQAVAWLVAFVICLKLIYALYSFIMSSFD